MPHPLDEVVLSRIVAAEASRDPDRLLYVFENAPHPAEAVTARDVIRFGNQLAAAFLDAGLGPGDRIGIMLREERTGSGRPRLWRGCGRCPFTDPACLCLVH